jgi:LEA14-like dessication related protein
MKSMIPVVLLLAGCPGAQVKPSSGEVNVVVRRIDVVSADYDKMKLNVILAVENGTSSDVEANADVAIALAGEGAGDADDSADEKKPASDDPKAVPEDEAPKAGSSDVVDSSKHTGSGGGKAAAFNTSELPVGIELPLPGDPSKLETVLGWKKMLVSVDGTVHVGFSSKKIGGTREVAPPHLPDVRLKEAQVASVDNGTAGTGFFTVLLDNKNPFPVTVDKMTWTITIKDKQLTPSTGQTSIEHDSVPASAVSEYSDEVLINEAAFGKELAKILKSPTVPYVIDGTVEVRGIEKRFHFNGDMKFAR